MHSNNTILSSDTYANDRADNHINMMQAQREEWELKEGKNNHDFELGVAVAALADLATER